MPTNNHTCKFCGADLNVVLAHLTPKSRAKRQFCNLRCVAKSNVKAQQTWEQRVAENLAADGWTIIRPMSCCDRLGVKDGRLYFLEFKPEGDVKLREYQQIVKDLAPHMYKVAFAKPATAEVVRIDGWVRPLQVHKKRAGGSSQLRGVHRDRYNKVNPWRAQITVNGKRLNLGNHKTQESAARVYDDACRYYFGWGVPLNFPATLHAIKR